MTATVIFIVYIAVRAIWIVVLKARWDNAVNHFAEKHSMNIFGAYGVKNLYFQHIIPIVVLPFAWRLSDLIPEEVYRQIIKYEKW